MRAGAGLPRLEIVSVIDTDRSRAEALATKAGATVAAAAETIMAGCGGALARLRV